MCVCVCVSVCVCVGGVVVIVGGGIRSLVQSIKCLCISIKKYFPSTPIPSDSFPSVNLMFLHSGVALTLWRWNSH